MQPKNRKTNKTKDTEKPLPVDVFVEETPHEEKQAITREIDTQKRKKNPDFMRRFTKGKNNILQQEKNVVRNNISKPKHRK